MEPWFLRPVKISFCLLDGQEFQVHQTPKRLPARGASPSDPSHSAFSPQAKGIWKKSPDGGLSGHIGAERDWRSFFKF